jgi:hypothetical protein
MTKIIFHTYIPKKFLPLSPTSHAFLRPIQTGRDLATRREFSVFKNKYNRQRIKILQDMQTK